ncbi:CAF17-like 4Fe-4S cluster assembly/insertion protein YgfZ [Ghiorsea bivora]|uniref:CAF17-like 4Fe-4S cluster assembly/insertion protein YgfZ n=1 Tax=Ghiorsea bivora TaxID=1485545 RepID=UPI00068C1BEB|nr:folate-binding protein YgfZ [Ghiorsea bivora]
MMQKDTPIDSVKVAKRDAYAVIKASGESLLKYLQGQVAQDVSKLSETQAIYSVILTPQGKPVSDFYLLLTKKKETWAEVMFLCPSAFALNLVERLRMFALGYELRIGKVSSWQVFSVQGGDVDDFLQANALPMPTHEKLASAHTDTVSILRMSEPSKNGVWVMGSDLPLSCNADENEIERGRILQGTPLLGVDWDIKLHPLNANLMDRDGVSFDKGCYVGQEVTSRMHWRGGIKKKLYRVKLEKDVRLPCAVLTTVKVGEVTSLAQDGDAYQGIALLPIETVEANQPLQTEAGDKVQVLGVCGE